MPARSRAFHMRSALLARPSKLSIRWPGATSTRQRVTPCVPVCAPVERVAQFVGVHTGKEGQGLVDRTLAQQALEVRQGSFHGESLHHRDDKAVHAKGVNFVFQIFSSGKELLVVQTVSGISPQTPAGSPPSLVVGSSAYWRVSAPGMASGRRSGQDPTARG